MGVAVAGVVGSCGHEWASAHAVQSTPQSETEGAITYNRVPLELAQFTFHLLKRPLAYYVRPLFSGPEVVAIDRFHCSGKFQCIHNADWSCECHYSIHNKKK